MAGQVTRVIRDPNNADKDLYCGTITADPTKPGMYHEYQLNARLMILLFSFFLVCVSILIRFASILGLQMRWQLKGEQLQIGANWMKLDLLISYVLG